MIHLRIERQRAYVVFSDVRASVETSSREMQRVAIALAGFCFVPLHRVPSAHENQN
jgi:hypothetical protein